MSTGIVDAKGNLCEESEAGDAAPRRRFRWAAVAVAGAVVVGAAGMTGVGIAIGHGWGVRAPEMKVVPSGTPTQLPVPAPAGWSSVASWSEPVGSSSAASVSSRGPLVYMAGTTMGSVQALEARTGAKVWSASVSDSALGTALAGGPLVAAMGERPVVVGWSSTTLFAWNPATGTLIGSWPLGASSKVVMSGGRVMTTGISRHVGVLGRDGLSTRVMPAGAVAVGATQDGALIAAGAGQVWMSRGDTVAGPGTALEAPAGMTWDRAVGYIDGLLVVAYKQASGDGRVVLRGYRTTTAGEWAQAWTSAALPGAAVQGNAVDLPLLVSPSRAWALLGTTWVDLRVGASRPLPVDWQTTAVGTRIAFGTTGGRVGVVSEAGALTAAPASTTGGLVVAPTAITDEGIALVIAADGAASSLYAVPMTGKPTSSSAPISPPTGATSAVPSSVPSPTSSPTASTTTGRAR